MRQKGIPVLMYHSLSANESVEHTGKNVSVSLAAFKEQMEFLYKNGYKTVSNTAIDEFPKSDSPGGSNFFMLTFDDGYTSWYRYAQDILSKFGFTATMFLSTAYVDGAYNMSDFKFVENDRPLTWPEIKELAVNGWSVQAHGHHHHNWTGIALSNLITELNTCKNEIEQKLGSCVNEVAYPYGAYNTQILHYLANTGCRAAYTVHPGIYGFHTNKFRIPRIEINNTDTLVSFQRKVETGYSSQSQKIRSGIRDLLYADPRVKDLVMKVTG